MKRILPFMLFLLFVFPISVFSSLKMEISTTKQNILPYENIYIQMKITNIGSKTETLDYDFDLSGDASYFEISKDGKKFSVLEPLSKGMRGSRPLDIYLAAKDSILHNYDISNCLIVTKENNKIKHSRLGSETEPYILRLVYWLKPNTYQKKEIKLVSNELKINVEKPNGIDLEAYKLMRQYFDMRSVNKDTLDEAISILRQLITQYPSSAYAVQGKYDLASILSFQAYTKYRNTLEANIRIEEAYKLYNSVSRDSEHYITGLYSQLSAAHCLRELGRYEEALGLYEAAFSSPFADVYTRNSIIYSLHDIDTALWKEQYSTIPIKIYPVMIPLKKYAQACGFIVTSNPDFKNVIINGSRISARVDLSSSQIVVNYKKYFKRMELRDNDVYIEPTAVSILLGEQYGIGIDALY